jgi:8-oxo-dGTP pyrophosphatase MutT (NUDIX family)
MKPERESTISAGGIVLRFRSGILEVLLVERTKNVEAKWAPVLSQLPKGSVESGETFEKAALREVREETGYDTNIVRKAGVASWGYQRSGSRWREEVHYFLMNLKSAAPVARDKEFERVYWIGVSEATAKLSYPEEKEIILNLRDEKGQWSSALLHSDVNVEMREHSMPVQKDGEIA